MNKRDYISMVIALVSVLIVQLFLGVFNFTVYIIAAILVIAINHLIIIFRK